MGALLSDVGEPLRIAGSYLGVAGLWGVGLSPKGSGFRTWVSREERVSACLLKDEPRFCKLLLMSVRDALIFLISSVSPCVVLAAAYEFPWAAPADSLVS